ncbi:FxsA family protein [candidate division KSB1 bacterium]|nr:FxsA family protein [candidate division KSB1 bacterium]
MRFWLLVLFIGVPLLEMAILIQLGKRVGFWSTLAIIILTGMVGAALARWQGLRVLMRIQEELHEGRIPAAEMLDGLLILIAGVMLVTPGFLSDLSGLLLLLPGVRHLVRNWLRQKLMRMMQSGRTHIFIRDRDFLSNGPL